MKLSILICNVIGREDPLEELKRDLNKQILECNAINHIEILVHTDQGCLNKDKDGNYGLPVGEKRQKLLEQAKGEYIVFIDDDDWVYPYYIEKILKAIKTNPDCLAINGIYTHDNQPEKKWYIALEHDYVEENNTYYRFPNHITPVKRRLALRAGFPDWRISEDYDYACRLRGAKKGEPHYTEGFEVPLLKTQVKIDKPMYWYRFKSANKTYR